jgi:cell division protein ZapA
LLSPDEMTEFSIKVNIAGTFYPLKIKAEDERNVRVAEELIQRKIQELQQNYGAIEKKDLLSMCLLQIATQNVLLEHKLTQNHVAFEQEKSDLDKSISEYLSREGSII